MPAPDPDDVGGRRPPLARALDAAATGCAVLSGMALAVMVAIIGVDVFARNFLGFSTQISEEYGGYLLVMAAFLAFPVAQARGRFHRFELIDGLVPDRVRLAVLAAVQLACLATALVIEWQLVRFLLLAIKSGASAPTLAGTPLWVPQLVMPLGFGLLCLILGARTVQTVASALRPVRGQHGL